MNDRCNNGPLQLAVLDQLSLPSLMPPENFITAEVRCTAAVPAVAWRVMSFVKSRVPHCMRGLLEAEVSVVPWGLADHRVVFAVPDTQEAIGVARTQLQLLSASVSLYREAGAEVQCCIQGEDMPIAVSEGELPEFLKQLDAYAASGATEPYTFPSTLTSRERALIHTRAELRGLVHRSSGSGDNRVVEISRLK